MTSRPRDGRPAAPGEEPATVRDYGIGWQANVKRTLGGIGVPTIVANRSSDPVVHPAGAKAPVFDGRRTIREFSAEAPGSASQAATGLDPIGAAPISPLSAEAQAFTVGARGEGTPGTFGDRPLSRVEPASNLFREQAVRAYERGEKLTSIVRVTDPSSWAFLLAVWIGLLSALAIGVLYEVDVIGRGSGILQTPGGAQSLAAPVSGTVSTIHARSGDTVQAGQLILTLDSTALRAELMQAQRRLELQQTRLRELLGNRELHERSVALLRTQAALTQRRLRSEHASLRTLSERHDAFRQLGARGYVARSEAEAVEEQMRAVERGRLALEEALAGTQLQEVTLERQRHEQLQGAEVEVGAAQAQKAALEAVLAQTELRAASAGRIEGLSARTGDQVQLGQTVARIVPVAAPTQVIAFAQDRDRAFLRPGSIVRLEVDQLPVAEFGVLHGRVTAISNHFVSNEEKIATLGEGAPTGPAFRVDIALDASAHNQHLLSRLRSGALVTARFVLRSRRLITLALEPLQAWLD